jgi:hypothetical protein
MLRMREQLPSDDAWRREAMGVTDETDTGGGLDLSAWSKMILKPRQKFKAQVFALDIAPDRSTACIVVAGWCGDRVAVQITSNSRGVPDNRPGLDWIRPRVRKLDKDSPDAKWVTLHRSQAASFTAFLEELDVELEQVSTADWPAMCSSMVDLITTGQALHAGDLGEPFTGAALVNVGEEQFRWGRKKSSIDITPVIAATLAAVTVFREGVPSTGDVLAAFK